MSGATGHNAPTRLHLVRRGGLAGLKVEREVAATDLLPAQRHALDKLLAAPPDGTRTAPGADRYHYRLDVTLADGSVRSLSVAEDDLPDALAPLGNPTL